VKTLRGLVFVAPHRVVVEVIAPEEHVRDLAQRSQVHPVRIRCAGRLDGDVRPDGVGPRECGAEAVGPGGTVRQQEAGADISSGKVPPGRAGRM